MRDDQPCASVRKMTTTRPHQNVPETGIIHMLSHRKARQLLQRSRRDGMGCGSEERDVMGDGHRHTWWCEEVECFFDVLAVLVQRCA